MNHLFKSLTLCLSVIVLFTCVSCARGSIYDSYLKAEEYFTDPQVIALCKAIEQEDLAEIERLISVGADVNARGKDTMTPLLWAYSVGEKALEKVLELGADPNTQYDSFFGTRGEIERGDSLLFIAIKSSGPKNTYNREKFRNYIDILLKHGADPNLIQAQLKFPPLKNTIRFKNLEAAEKLIKAGADVNFKDNTGRSLLSYAAGLEAYSVLRLLIDYGADYRTISNVGLTVAQTLGSDYDKFMGSDSEIGRQYREVVACMETRGMSIERAKEQWELWQNKPVVNGDYEGSRQKYIKEVVEPEIARWLPPGVEAPIAPAEQPVQPLAPPAAQRGNVFVPVVIAFVVFVFLAGGIWLWIRKRGKIAP